MNFTHTERNGLIFSHSAKVLSSASPAKVCALVPRACLRFSIKKFSLLRHKPLRYLFHSRKFLNEKTLSGSRCSKKWWLRVQRRRYTQSDQKNCSFFEIFGTFKKLNRISLVSCQIKTDIILLTGP